jgi:cell fate regulator YaaT (PSP1 superfamily)
MSGVQIVGVQFRRAGKIYNFLAGEHSLRAGDDVVVETERGQSLAKVVLIKFVPEVADPSIKPVTRIASKTDVETRGKLSDAQATTFARERAKFLNLDMRVLKSEIQFGGNKAIIYFSAPGRVDFRELVKELATGLRARVELKQIGARDEAKIVGGLGICGREYCCSSFLRDFVPVSIKMAKNQNLALNPSKVSGGCGRLLCCLTYENDTYNYLRKKLPPKGARVNFGDEEQGDVIKTDILNQLVVVETNHGQQVTLRADQIQVTGARNDDQSSDDTGGWGEDIDLDALNLDDDKS